MVMIIVVCGKLWAMLMICGKLLAVLLLVLVVYGKLFTVLLVMDKLLEIIDTLFETIVMNSMNFMRTLKGVNYNGKANRSI